MAFPETKTINVIIAGRPYPLRVQPKEEKGVRDMADEINERFNDFQVKFGGRDKMDCLVMTLLTFADELRTARGAVAAGPDSELTDRLQALDALVDSML